jgi:hypothetical protein
MQKVYFTEDNEVLFSLKMYIFNKTAILSSRDSSVLDNSTYKYC